jgi:hypothetical protein
MPISTYSERKNVWTLFGSFFPVMRAKKSAFLMGRAKNKENAFYNLILELF